MEGKNPAAPPEKKTSFPPLHPRRPQFPPSFFRRFEHMSRLRPSPQYLLSKTIFVAGKNKSVRPVNIIKGNSIQRENKIYVYSFFFVSEIEWVTRMLEKEEVYGPKLRPPLISEKRFEPRLVVSLWSFRRHCVPGQLFFSVSSLSGSVE